MGYPHIQVETFQVFVMVMVAVPVYQWKSPAQHQHQRDRASNIRQLSERQVHKCYCILLKMDLNTTQIFLRKNQVYSGRDH